MLDEDLTCHRPEEVSQTDKEWFVLLAMLTILVERVCCVRKQTDYRPMKITDLERLRGAFFCGLGPE
jgi:hypothetical protein